MQTVETSPITDVNRFIFCVQSMEEDTATIYRGQPHKGNLLPGLARESEGASSLVREKTVMEQLLLTGNSLLSRPTCVDLDLLVLAQHFGLQTRLLDWTSNPLAALWFACAAREDGDVYVYTLSYSKFQDPKVYEKGPFSHRRTVVFQPRLNNARIVAQHGWFTLHAFSRHSNKFVPLEKHREIKSSICEYVIPQDHRSHLLQQLDRLGVNQRTLFPDLEGLCRYLNWKHP